MVVSVAAGFRHLRLVRELDRGGVTRPHPATLAVLMALFLACIGIGMTIYLISVRSENHTGAKTLQEGWGAMPKGGGSQAGALLVCSPRRLAGNGPASPPPGRWMPSCASNAS